MRSMSLRREGDLGNQQQYVAAPRQHLGDQVDVDFGLARPGDALAAGPWSFRRRTVRAGIPAPSAGAPSTPEGGRPRRRARPNVRAGCRRRISCAGGRPARHDRPGADGGPPRPSQCASHRRPRPVRAALRTVSGRAVRFSRRFRENGPRRGVPRPATRNTRYGDGTRRRRTPPPCRPRASSGRAAPRASPPPGSTCSTRRSTPTGPSAPARAAACRRKARGRRI